MYFVSLNNKKVMINFINMQQIVKITVVVGHIYILT